MTATTIRVQMAQRKDTAANWTAANPILLSGEIGYETDTKKFKIGNGSTAWNSLAYLPIPDGSGNLTITGNLEIGSTGSLTFEGSTADGFETTLAVTNPTADRTITLPNVTGTVVTTGDTGSVTSTMIANGTIVDADISSTAEIAVSKLANGTANQVIVTDGTNVSWSDNLTLAGDLTVNGTTTTINTQDLLVEDKNIIIGNVATPSDVTADGGGITLKGATDKTINWVDATDAWTLSEHVNIASGKEYRIAGTKVLDATSLGSSVLITSANITDGTIVDGDISATAEIAVSKLADGAARQLLQTDAAGTGVEWASNIDIPGTLDVTGAATFDSSVAVTGTLTKSGNNVVTVGDTGTVTSTMILDGTIVDGDVNATAAIAGTKISPNFGSQNVTTTGTSTAASFIPTSSTAPTNGLYLSGTNTVGISTGGTGRLFVDASGNVGVGGAASTWNLGKSIEIGGTDPVAIWNPGDGFNAISNVYYNSGYKFTTNGGYGLYYQQNTGLGAHIFATTTATGTANGAATFSEQARIRADGMFEVKGAGTAGSSPAFSVSGSAPANSFVIDSSGRVGIGTASPSTRFNIAGYASTDQTPDILIARSSSGTAIQTGPNITFSDGTGTSTTTLQVTQGRFGVWNYGSSAWNERFCVTGAGNVGIGTTSPAVALDVAGAGNSTPALILRGNSATGNSGGLALYNASTDASERNWYLVSNSVAYGDFVIRQGTTQNGDPSAGTARFYINPSGNVGIGTTSPNFNLSVGIPGTTADSTIQIASATNSTGNLFFGDTAGGGTGSFSGYIQYSHTNDSMSFGTASSPRATIDASGRVGIGTTSPAVALDIANGDLRIKRSATNDGAVYFGSTLTNYIFSGNSSNIMAFAVNNSEAARLDSFGRLLVGTSSNTGGALLQVNGDRVRIATAKTPASATDTGSAGEICWDANYIYVCTATNTWKRTAIATW